ncbi:TonB-dependent receptor [Mucilaginibacter sp. RCC_168]|uniref:TonB-dependent receptor domain-containing protein n=1 Tax=Mucilaginibacter sp. RCC_168 TaxID=3239221 RepID=UPI003523E5A1
MKRILFILIIFWPLHLLAQHKLIGTIVDAEARPLDAATVSLLHDGKVISKQFAQLGKYTFDVDKQLNYQLLVSLVGYKSQTVEIRYPFPPETTVLVTERKQLAEVIIAYKKPTIERKADKVIFNVEKSSVAAGGTLLEAIAKSPGVQVTSTGGISASNKGVTVYMNDKPVRLSGDDLSTYLASIPADQISKIEIMSNPSAKYEAQGGAVINIVSKKITGEGLNANINGSYTQGHVASGRAGGLLNYSKGKWNIFGNYSYSDRNQHRAITNDILYEQPSNNSYWNIDKVLLPKTRTHNYSFGFDYNLSPNQVFGVLVTGNNNTNANNSLALTTVTNGHKTDPDSLLNTINHNTGNTDQYSFNLNYKIKLSSHQASLNADLDYVPYHTSGLQSVNNTSINSAGILTSAPYRSLSPSHQDIDIWSGKADYEMHFNSRFSLESGVKYNSITTRNKFDFFDTSSGERVFDAGKSDFFKYMEQTAAGYGALTGHIGKLDIKAGLRAEQTYTTGISYAADSINKNSYLRFFPSAFLSYRFSDENVLGFNFARRIDRPGYSQLNPAKVYASPYAYSSGNPFLLSATSTNMELNYTFKSQYTVTASYYGVTNLTNQVTVQDNLNQTFFTTWQNTGNIRDIGVQFMTTTNPTSWWEINNYLDGYARKQDLRYLTGHIENSFHFYLKTDNALTISKDHGWKAQVSAWYLGPLQQGTYHFGKTWDVSTGISKSLWNNTTIVRLAANDLFFSNPIHIKVNYLNQHTAFIYKNDSRNVLLSFTYKIGKNVNEARKRQTASEDEKQRNH